MFHVEDIDTGQFKWKGNGIVLNTVMDNDSAAIQICIKQWTILSVELKVALWKKRTNNGRRG